MIRLLRPCSRSWVGKSRVSTLTRWADAEFDLHIAAMELE
jgi:hypothetical protein